MSSNGDILNMARNALLTGAGLPDAIFWMKKTVERVTGEPMLFYLLGLLLMKAGNQAEGLRAIGEAQRLLLASGDIADPAAALAKIRDYSLYRQMQDPVFGGFFSTSAFGENLSPAEKRLIFKENVHFVEFESSSLCNRVCHYCPISLMDRRTENIIMDSDIFAKVITELAEIGYDKVLNMSGFNEPLADRGILERIALARRLLPGAYLQLNSNGDYLTRDYLEELRAAGLNDIKISIHRQPKEPYSTEAAAERVRKMAERLRIETYHFASDPAGTRCSASFPFEGMAVLMFQSDYENYGLDRAGLLEGIGLPFQGRTSACIMPIVMFTIHYNGNVMPCCHFVGDNKRHESYVCGNVKEQSIFDIYCGEALLDWRHSLFSVEKKQSPCDTCSRDVEQPSLNNPANFVNLPARHR